MAILALGLALYVSCQKGASSALTPTYVGDSACMRCHADITRAYASTWKAHSLLSVTSGLRRIENFFQAPVYDPHKDFYYRARWERDTLYFYEYRLRESDTVFLRKERIDFVVGSGHQTRSYLLWRNGFLYEAPITWYVRAGRWDLSPGYAEGRNSRFSREIQPACLACHASGWVAVPYTYNRYEKVGGPLGCESCHGPGSLHVANPQDPAYHWRKWSPLRQMDVCSRCHLEGIAVEKRTGWRPGDSLAAYWAIFLPERPELGQFGIASHAERLMRSACYQKGGLTCTGCHNPHPTGSVPAYEGRCLGCHTQGCASPKHPSDGCVGCHMPKGPTSDIPHTQFTDHYIRVVRSAPVAPGFSPKLVCATEAYPAPALVGEAYLKWYIEERPEGWVLDTAVALLRGGERPAAFARALLLKNRPQQALTAAEKALRGDSTLPVLELYAYCLEGAGLVEKALQVWAEIVRKAPAYPEARFRYATLAYLTGKLPPVEAYKILQAVWAEWPWEPHLAYNAGIVAAGLGRYAEAQRYFSAALALDPDYKPAQQALARLP